MFQREILKCEEVLDNCGKFITLHGSKLNLLLLSIPASTHRTAMVATAVKLPRDTKGRDTYPEEGLHHIILYYCNTKRTLERHSYLHLWKNLIQVM